MDELRAVTAYAVACAEPVLHLFNQACSQDRRPATAMDAARAFAEGGRRSRRQRTAATDAHRAGREAASEAARHAALAAGAPARPPPSTRWPRPPSCATSSGRPRTPLGRASWPAATTPSWRTTCWMLPPSAPPQQCVTPWAAPARTPSTDRGGSAPGPARQPVATRPRRHARSTTRAPSTTTRADLRSGDLLTRRARGDDRGRPERHRQAVPR